MVRIDRFSYLYQRHPNWAAFLTFIILVALFHWPLVLHLSTHVAARPFDDVFGILWDLDWAQQAIFEDHVTPFFTRDIFYPHGFYVSSSSPPMWWFVVFSPLTYLFGPIITYNLLTLALYALAGLGIYFLVVHLGGQWAGGILAGCIFIFAPLLTIRMGGHTDILLSTLWLPYLALFSHKVLTSQATRIPSWVVAGLFLGLACLGHWQFVFFAPLLPLVIVGLGRSEHNLRYRVILIFKIAVIALLTISPFLVLTIQARAQMYAHTPSFSITTADALSLSIDRLFVPNPLNSIWGQWSGTTFPVNSEASIISVGYMATFIAAVGLFLKWSERRSYFILLLIAIVGALGIRLHWNEQPVVLPLSIGLAKLIRPVIETIVGPDLMPPGETMIIPLPLAFLYHIFPILSFTRVWARYMIVGMLAIGVIAGLGATFFIERLPRLAHLVVVLMLTIVFLEGHLTPYRHFTEVSTNQRPIDYWLAEQPKLSLIEYPLPSANKLAMYSQSIHHQRIVNGYASVTPSFFAEALPTLGMWPNPAGTELLRAWQVDYVLVNGNLGHTFQEEIRPKILAVTGLCLIRIDTETDLNRQTLFFRVLQSDQSCE